MAEASAKSDSTPGKSKTAALRYWTKGSIPKNLWALSWPMLVSYTLMMIGPVIDMIWVGKLGAVAIAGVGAAGIAVLMVDQMRMGLDSKEKT
jgi:Na+-driven multidrug efflux pump